MAPVEGMEGEPGDELIGRDLALAGGLLNANPLLIMSLGLFFQKLSRVIQLFALACLPSVRSLSVSSLANMAGANMP